MPDSGALAALSALAHPHRLAAFRRLVEAGPEGLPAGALAEALGLPQSSLSFHLAHLARSALVLASRQGRQIRYAADFDAISGLVGYLTENCCGGRDCSSAQARSAA